MDIGMLWFDNNKSINLDSRVENAAGYYKNKYRKQPNLCYVHPTMLDIVESDESGEEDAMSYQIGTIKVMPSAIINPNYFWLGVKEKKE